MKKITKTLKTKEQAQKFEAMLWNKYARIELVDWPTHREAGRYIWIVSY